MFDTVSRELKESKSWKVPLRIINQMSLSKSPAACSRYINITQNLIRAEASYMIICQVTRYICRLARLLTEFCHAIHYPPACHCGIYNFGQNAVSLCLKLVKLFPWRRDYGIWYLIIFTIRSTHDTCRYPWHASCSLTWVSPLSCSEFKQRVTNQLSEWQVNIVNTGNIVNMATILQLQLSMQICRI